MNASLDTDILTAFISVVEAQGFTKAALRLHRTQSAVSLQIKRLEDIVGTPLLVRTPRAIQLTKAGETFLVYAKRIVHLQEEALLASSDTRGPSIVRLGLPEDYATWLLPPLLREMKHSHPDIQLHITCSMSVEIVEQLEKGELDLTVGIRCTPYSDGRMLCEEDLVWAAGPGFAIAPEETVPLAVFPAGCPFRARGLDALAGIGRPAKIVYTSQNPTGISIAVRESLGVTICSRRTMPADWRVMTASQGFPDLPHAELELHRSPTALHTSHDIVVGMIESYLKAPLAAPHWIPDAVALAS